MRTIQSAVIGIAAVLITVLLSLPLRADEIQIYSSPSTTTGACVANSSGSCGPSGMIGTSNASFGINSALTTGNTAGLSFTAAESPYAGSASTYLPTPAGGPAAMTTVVVPGALTGIDYPSGFFEDTFTLPTDATSISLAGAGAADDFGYVWLNGNLIGELYIGQDTTFGASDMADFVLGGVNTLLISDINSGEPRVGPSIPNETTIPTGSTDVSYHSPGDAGAIFYADISYETPSYNTPSSVTPEPGGLLLLGSGMIALAAVARRKIRQRA